VTGTFGQLARYAIVGIVTNVLGYLLYLGITALGLGPKKAMTILYVVGVLISFAGNRRWTFSHEGPVGASLLRFSIAHLAGYALNFAILFVFVDRFGYSHQVVQAVAIVIVAAWLFVAFRAFVFRSGAAPGRAP
jgi:putative flippase GtrA